MLQSRNSIISIKKKRLDEYDLLIIDLDGTLYFQPSFHISMACALVQYFFRHPMCLYEIIVIQKYRKLREKWEEKSENIDQKIYEKISAELSISTQEVKRIIEFHMLKNPLVIIGKHKDILLEQFIQQCRKNGKKVVIYSDYPVEDKLRALNIDVDYMFSSTDKEIGCLKPDPRGISFIVNKLNYDANDVVMIGDRFEKDAMAAINNKIDYVILPRKKRKRKKIYRLLSII